MNMIKDLGWITFCGKLDEGTLQLVRKFYTMVERIKADVGWIIYNNIINSLGPTKGHWFSAIITKLCT